MGYIDKIFLRCNLQQISSFLLDGVECQTDPRPYEERIKGAQKELSAWLRQKFPDEKEVEQIIGIIYQYSSTTEPVYLELGLQLGATLAAQAARNLIAAYSRDQL